MGTRPVGFLVALSVIAVACGGSGSDDAVASGTTSVELEGATSTTVETQESTAGPEPTSIPRIEARVDPATVPTGEVREFGPAPDTPSGPLEASTADAIEVLMGTRLKQRVIDARSYESIEALGQSQDPRVAWLLTDMMRIANDADLADAVRISLQSLLDIDIEQRGSWNIATDHLIAWDTPAPPDYLMYKRNAFMAVDPRWEPLFPDDTDIDWRLMTWGGVLIDDRPYDKTDSRCRCIPAADNPTVTDVAGGEAWLTDDTIVFGVVINGEARAYPRSIMEVREMVNDTLGGRDIAMPYCTLCGSAQVYFTDELPDGVERPVLRTSGLLLRSNKVMYDVNTNSIFDTFLGKAVSGPLLEAGVELSQNSVITTTWGQWKSDHPDTTVLAEELALGRSDSDLRNTRDADGPIFPIGNVDARLPVQEDVLGVVTADGTPIAFHVDSAIEALDRGEFVEVAGVEIILEGGGVRAVDADGNDLGGHQAFWFAWSQFYPDTELWPELGS